METTIAPLRELAAVLASPATGRVAVLADTHTARLCLPHLKPYLPADFLLIEIGAGETYKTLETCQYVWAALTRARVNRDGLLVCLGGGTVTDLGGFVAATYLRGIRCALVPTTLLAMVDAAIGGKTGVDLDGLKNHLGVFREPTDGIFLDEQFLTTLDPTELVSGYAEVVKHWLIGGIPEEFMLGRRVGLAGADWSVIIPDAIATKQRIVAADPFENGERRLLNFGHTIGHALETHALRQRQPVPHGVAVAAGMLAEAWISREQNRLDTTDFDRLETFLFATFPKVKMQLSEAEAIAELALHDKKNTRNEIRCVLLTNLGHAVIDQPVTVAEIAAALRYYALL